jgi:hypothetical protein
MYLSSHQVYFVLESLDHEWATESGCCGPEQIANYVAILSKYERRAQQAVEEEYVTTADVIKSRETQFLMAMRPPPGDDDALHLLSGGGSSSAGDGGESEPAAAPRAVIILKMLKRMQKTKEKFLLACTLVHRNADAFLKSAERNCSYYGDDRRTNSSYSALNNKVKGQ